MNLFRISLKGRLFKFLILKSLNWDETVYVVVRDRFAGTVPAAVHLPRNHPQQHGPHGHQGRQ